VIAPISDDDDDVVFLDPFEPEINLSIEEQNDAMDIAMRRLNAECEWTWTNEEAQAMAEYVLWAGIRIAAIEQLVCGKLFHQRD
jgi:hypothetical protein